MALSSNCRNIEQNWDYDNAMGAKHSQQILGTHRLWKRAHIVLATICWNMILISKTISCNKWYNIKSEVKFYSCIYRQIIGPYWRQIIPLQLSNNTNIFFRGRLYLFHLYIDRMYTAAMRISRDGVNKVCSGNLLIPTGHKYKNNDDRDKEGSQVHRGYNGVYIFFRWLLDLPIYSAA